MTNTVRVLRGLLTHGSSGRVLGLRTTALVEIALFLVLALAIDAATTGDRFWSVSPHPFWLLVVLVSLQYGANEGLVAALAASGALLLGNLPETAFGQDLYAYWLDITTQPILWLVTAIVIGEVRSRQLVQRRKLENDFASARHEADSIAEAYARLESTKERLEARLASELRTALTIWEGARAVDGLDQGQVLRGAGELIGTVLAPEKYSLFILHNDALEAAMAEGWRQDDRFRRFFGADTALFEAVIGRQCVLCIADARDEADLEGEGLLAAPLITPGEGKVVGMLKIESMAFVDLTPTMVENFRMACAWIAAALERARRFEETRERGIATDPDTPLPPANALQDQARFLARLGARLGFESCIVTVRCQYGHLMPAEERNGLSAAVAGALASALRETDLAFEFGRFGREVAVLLPGTPVASADVVLPRLETAVRARLPEALVSRHLELTAEPIETMMEQAA